GAHTSRATHPGLRRTAREGEPVEQGHPPVSQTRHRPRDPPRPAQPDRRGTGRSQGPTYSEEHHPDPSRSSTTHLAGTPIRHRTPHSTTAGPDRSLSNLARNRLTHNRSINGSSGSNNRHEVASPRISV